MDRGLKILHLSASDSGGAYIFAENLIAEFENSEIKIKHLVYSGKHENFRFIKIKWIDHLIKFGLHAFEKSVLFFYEKNKDVRFKFSLGYPGIPRFVLKRIIRDYDIIHLHWINKGFINIGDLAFIDKPMVWTCHDLWPVSGGCHLSLGCMNFTDACGNCHFMKSPGKNDLSHRLFKIKENLYQNKNISFVSPSHWMDENISVSNLGKKHRHIPINNGIDTEVFQYRENAPQEKQFVIGFVAANLNDKNKALYRLIEAIQHLEDPQDYHLLLIGKQKTDFEFEIPISYTIVSDAVNKQQMAEQYRRMQVLVCTSTIETFPTTLMEAFCCGVYALGFQAGGISEILEKMKRLPINAFDTRALAIAIQEIKTTGYDKKSLSLQAKEKFSIRHTAESYQKLYQELVNQ